MRENEGWGMSYSGVESMKGRVVRMEVGKGERVKWGEEGWRGWRGAGVREEERGVGWV